MSYTRQNCTIDKSLSTFNKGVYDYQTNLATFIRPNALAIGSGPGPTVNVSTYTQGPPRVTIGGGAPGRNILFHRSSLSSACPANALTSFPDTLDNPILLTEEQKRVMNKGFGMASYQTRNFQTNSHLLESDIVAQYMNKPNKQFSDGGWWGFHPISGMGQLTRTSGMCDDNQKFRLYKNIGPSASSYGSYGQM
jgi:hypothetical protein